MKSLKNDPSIELHLKWFQAVLSKRVNHYFEASQEPFQVPDPPMLSRHHPLDQTFKELNLSWEAKAIIMLALTPHLRPQILDIFFTSNSTLNRSYTEFGGLKGKNHNGFLPTKETAAFIIAGTDLQKRIEVMRMLRQDHPLYHHQILEFTNTEEGEPSLSMPLRISNLFLPKILWNEFYLPEFGSGFPAKEVKTKLDWEDLVLSPYVLQEVMEIKSWLEHEQLIQEKWKLNKLIKPGYRSLFFGPPGTGKTLTASLLGKSLNMPVYRIDLAMIISKYIGETEKNLAKVFDLAEHNNWILFFDEADALFGKRTITQSSNDRYANQEVSYLLQRIEDFPGLTILASNFKDNLDEAFIRRFQSMIYFPMPGPRQRLELWQKAFSSLQLAENVNLKSLAEKYELSGGEMINVLRFVAIRTVKSPDHLVQLEDIIQGLRKEFQKKGGVLNL